MFLLALFLFAQEPCLDDVVERGWSAHIEHRFGEVRGEVEQRLASANDAEVYEMACLYAMAIDDQQTPDPSQDLIDLFETSFGVRREEAAIQIASHGHAKLSSELRTRVIDALRDRLLDAATLVRWCRRRPLRRIERGQRHRGARIAPRVPRGCAATRAHRRRHREERPVGFRSMACESRSRDHSRTLTNFPNADTRVPPSHIRLRLTR